jgi:hypothetical protein
MQRTVKVLLGCPRNPDASPANSSRARLFSTGNSTLLRRFFSRTTLWKLSGALDLRSGNHSHVLDVLPENSSQLRQDQPRIVVFSALGERTQIPNSCGLLFANYRYIETYRANP